MDKSTASQDLGLLWAQAQQGRGVLALGTQAAIGISPALIAILAQVAAALIPVLLKRCSPEAIHLIATDGPHPEQRKRIERQLQSTMGWFRWWWYGGHKLTDAAIQVAKLPSSVEMFRAFEGS